LECCLCESDDVEVISYLNCRGGGFSRNMAYMLPEPLPNLLSKISPSFSRLYHPIKINKKFFSRKAIYCKKCHTGYVFPKFAEEELDEYYREFYWANRGHHESGQDTVAHTPASHNISLSRERIAWIGANGVPISSVIDFGAGDCAAAYTFSADFGIKDITVVDKSTRSRDIAKIMGLSYYDSLNAAPLVDLVFSAHSIEHVHDLKDAFQLIVSKVNDGGHIFFETPNIADPEIFGAMPHTPHTYMLSVDSMMQLASAFSCELIAAETVGPSWKRAYPGIKSEARPDLRVLLRKIGDGR
jgi:2-polyprenyl-3-methyl-5-hydroxy-6-metoxy-1,4-benzoquinol methylase